MLDNLAISDIAGLSKPLNTLIKKISNGCGIYYRPKQIRKDADAQAYANRVAAQANANVAVINAHAQSEVADINQRALERATNEEIRKQANIESIIDQTIPLIQEDAQPEKLEPDWLVYFFEQSRLTSDEEMQSLWAKILAGQVNKPGSFSKRTISTVVALDKKDAQLFTQLCTTIWLINKLWSFPLIFDLRADIYKEIDMPYFNLLHLNDIGLITLNGLSQHTLKGDSFSLNYFNTHFNIVIGREIDFKCGHVVLTQAGEELFPICGAQKSDKFCDYVTNHWRKQGYTVTKANPPPPS